MSERLKNGKFFVTFLMLVSMLIFPASLVYSQVNLCNGNLGDNIFTTGDFGSGPSNIFPVNPGFAPGFIYTTQVPPDDGEYTITNNMALWPNLFPTWIPIGDNDPNPNGYMMVVNASFMPGIFYEQIIDNVCPNTLYEFTADIINIIETGTSGHNLPNVSFLIDDISVYTTGPILQDETWHTFGFTFTSGPGQNSVKLTLRNNAPGGIGNDLALDNISFRPCGPVSSISIEPEGKICEFSVLPVITAHIAADTGALQWQISLDSGIVWNNIPGAIDTNYQVDVLSTGIYYFRYLYSTSIANLTNSKCRIISDEILVEVVPVQFHLADTICEGLTFDLGGVLYGETGIYQEHLTAVNGCDSIVTLDLIVVPDPHISASFDFTIPSCEGADDGSISVVAVSGTRPPFDFRVGDSIIPPPGTSISLSAGTYTVWIEDMYGCNDHEVITIPDGPPLEINTIDDTTIVLGHSILLETTSSLPVWMSVWSPAIGLTCPACLGTQAMPLGDQTYVITAETEAGCIDSDSLTIRVDNDPVIYVPNVFSPNNDQLNDLFSIVIDPLLIASIDQVLIFDRWGGIISGKGNLTLAYTVLCWDGNTRWGPALPGTYVYLIKFTIADGTTKVLRGDVTVVK